MASWAEFAAAVPELGATVEARFRDHKHHTMATVRRDGGPRISGTEVELVDGQLRLGMMPGTVRAADLRRDPRVAIHSHCVDPPDDEPPGWVGEAKVAGRAVELPDAGDGAERFAVDITDVVLTRVGTPPDHLLIESWTPAGGLVRRERR